MHRKLEACLDINGKEKHADDHRLLSRKESCGGSGSGFASFRLSRIIVDLPAEGATG